MWCSIHGCEEQASYRCPECRRPVCSHHMVVHRGVPLGCVRCKEQERQRTLRHVQALDTILPSWAEAEGRLHRPGGLLPPRRNPKRLIVGLTGLIFYGLTWVLIILGYTEGPLGPGCVGVALVLRFWARTMPQYIDG